MDITISCLPRILRLWYHKIFKQKGKSPLDPLVVDCANGIGAPCLEELLKYVPVKAALVNDDVKTSSKLNFECGADFVKLYQKVPGGSAMVSGQRCCSLDGDADRIVFYFQDQSIVVLT